MSGIRVQGEIFRPFEVFIMVALLYWGFNESIAFLMRKIERKANKARTSNQNTAEKTTFISRGSSR